MSWITDDWRLKLLALALAVLMLGAVAFSQNPPTIKSLNVQLNYRLPPQPGIVIMNGPSEVPVTVTGLADVIGQVSSHNTTAFADATHANPGRGVKLNVTASSTLCSSCVQNPPQIVVNIDQLKTVQVPVTVNYRAAPGWTVDKAIALCPPNPSPCNVHFSGPASWQSGIQAFVDYTPIVNFTSQDSQNWPVKLVNSNGAIDLSQSTNPPLSLDFYNVAVHIEAHYGSTTTSVPLIASVANPPAPQYEVTGITVNPVSVVISGDPAVLSRIQRIVLPAEDLSGATSTVFVSVTIPYPDNVSPGSVAIAKVTYIIQRNPNVTPSP